MRPDTHPEVLILERLVQLGDSLASLLPALPRDAAPNGGGVSWYLPDRLGTVGDNTGSRGAVIDHVDTAFGQVYYESAASRGDRFKFAGRELDQLNLGHPDNQVNLYQNRARYYDPAAGRFISQDRLVRWRGAGKGG